MISETSKELIVKSKIDISRLKVNQYTISLLNEAYRVKMLDINSITGIQLKIMDLLKELILQYTNGNSTSVTIDTAEDLFCSVLYAIDAYTLNCYSPEEAVTNLNQGNIEQIYKKGIEQIIQWFEDTKKLYLKVRKNSLKVLVESYNLFVTEAMPLFLKNYNMVFHAHITVGNIDYPLVFDDMSIQGVLYIFNYLKNFKTETDFCRFFNSEEIDKLLNNYGAVLKVNYRIELINVFEMVFNNAVFRMISGREINTLNVSEHDFNVIVRKLHTMNEEDISSTIDTAVEQLCSSLGITDKDILDYILRYKAVFVRRVINSVKTNSLASIIITEQEKTETENILSLEVGQRMDDLKFNKFVRRLSCLSNTAAKVKLINTEITSLYDFIDILTSACFFGDEYKEVFSYLGEWELAVLIKIVYYEEMKDKSLELFYIVKSCSKQEDEWREYFSIFLRKLPKEKLSGIEAQLNRVVYEELKFN